MEAMSILAPGERTVRAKLQLFLRLWAARQKYEHLRPYGAVSGQRIRFHLAYLHVCWDKVVQYQRILGLEITPFGPRDQFELIYVVSAFVDRELNQPGNAIVDFTEKWRNYQTALAHLSHDLNPFDFGETCSYCLEMIRSLCDPSVPDDPIPFEPKEPHLHEFPRRLVLQSA